MSDKRLIKQGNYFIQLKHKSGGIKNNWCAKIDDGDELFLLNTDGEILKKFGINIKSREEEIRQNIAEERASLYPVNYEYFYKEAIELIEILDKRLEDE